MGKHHINHGNRERNINLVTRLTWLANKYLPPWLISCGNTNYCKRNSSLKKRHSTNKHNVQESLNGFSKAFVGIPCQRIKVNTTR